MNDDPIELLNARITKLEIAYSSMKTDLNWVKKLVGVQILLLVVNLISMAYVLLGGKP